MTKGVRIAIVAALFSSLFLAISPMQVAQAAVGDTDTYLNYNSSGAGTCSTGTSCPWGSLVSPSNGTFETWVKYTGSSPCTSQQVIGGMMGFELACANSYWRAAILSSGVTWTYTTDRSNETVTTNAWTHLAFTWANPGSVLFYVNGVLTDTTTSNVTINASGSGIYLGRYQNVQEFQGGIDDTMLWATQRTQAQIQSDMNNRPNVSDSNLKAYYDFNDVTNDTVTNRALNGFGTAADLTRLSGANFPENVTTDTSSINGYTVKIFSKNYSTANGGWKVPVNATNASVVVVGGGGGGSAQDAPSGATNAGWVGGGGGAGGYVRFDTFTLTSGNFIPIQIGAGGTAGIIATNYLGLGKNGGNTVFNNSTTSYGGGAGGGWSNSAIAPSDPNGFSGASGGGGGVYGGTGGSAIYGSQGRAGGTANASCCATGGGGGYASVGSDATTATAGGNGGDGLANPFVATPAFISAGGNGGAQSGNSFVQNTNSPNGQTKTATNAAVNSGSGGAAGGGGASTWQAPTSGANGLIMIKYLNPFSVSISYSGTPAKTTKLAGATTITATTTSTGTVSFYANGRLIPNCKNVSVSGTTATCAWKPITHGVQYLSATYTSNDFMYLGSANSSSLGALAGKRTSSR